MVLVAVFSYVKDLVTLFLGDLVVLFGSLWLALVARHFVAPNSAEYLEHVVPFGVLFIASLVVFAMVGLYDRTVALFEDRLPRVILEAQVFNLAIALAFFFLAPIDIQPKTILALYFVISTTLVVIWRLGIFRLRSLARPEHRALVIGYGSDMRDLVEALNAAHQNMTVDTYVDTTETESGINIDTHMNAGVTIIIKDPRVTLTTPLPRDVVLLDASLVYEWLFNRVALSLVDERELSLYVRSTTVYWFCKRVIDIVLSSILLVGLLILLPFVYLAVKLESRGPLCISQERIGKDWRAIRVYKFRTMTKNDRASKNWVGESDNRVTRVGAFLRRTSIDELPQIISVFWGDLSLIGPRSDILGLGERLRAELPLYHARYQVTPGISGWAQVNQQYAPGNISPQSIEESRVRLMYDLYYVKHHSLPLDLSITLKTVRTLVRRLIP